MDWNNTGRRDRADTTVRSRTTFNDSQGTPPSIAIAMTLANLEDTPPSQTSFTLADEVDPDALDALVTGDIHDVEVTFTVNDYLIVAQSNGRVQIRDVEE
ncbi:HalOD1 output domain-containing protein [Halorussus salinisoli]|uniref:HalOD1 output domain-containing protein n=1 Tax=Halorussus salinisoli TaxID=2558242 RepID=UPI001484CD4A|nr:HalOD1 output domain-containing protein [Halorussus salinisoli]